MSKYSDHHVFKIRRLKKRDNPFINTISGACDGTLHEQFFLRETFTNPENNPFIIYRAANFGSPAADAVNTANAVNDTNDTNGIFVFPRGTVIARNLANAPFTFSVLGGGEDLNTLIVPPNNEVAITTDAIREVRTFTNYPGDPIKAIFIFDIFLPKDPILPE